MGDFNSIVTTINGLKHKSSCCSDDELKEIYGLYKQATMGDINLDKPSVTASVTDLKVGR